MHRAGHAERAPLARNLAPDDGVGTKLFAQVGLLSFE